MKAIKITIGYNEWHKLEPFISGVQDEDTFAYMIDNTTAIVVTEGECGMSYIKGCISESFDKYNIDHIQ